MDLLLLRHGKAEDFHKDGDAARALVPKGFAQARKAGLLLTAAKMLPEIVLTSPLTRARETAEEFCAAAGLPGPVVQSWLACGCHPETLATEMAAFRDFKRAMVVGHEPDLSQFIQWTLGAHGDAVEMKKGAIVCLRISPPARSATLRFHIPPKLAAAAIRADEVAG